VLCGITPLKFLELNPVESQKYTPGKRGGNKGGMGRIYWESKNFSEIPSRLCFSLLAIMSSVVREGG
jgi:hypothetical protein